MMVALNLMQGLDRLGVPYRFNDHRYIKKHPEEIACIIGKPPLLFDRTWPNPVIFGAGVFSHPIDKPDLLERYNNIQRILVPGEWIRNMFEPYYGDKVKSWPVGIDTNFWHPFEGEKTIDFLIYYKIRWQHERMQKELIDPLTDALDKRGLSYQFIRYGNYTHADLIAKLKTSKAVIFLCEHETQGLAYQQILAAGTPILAWDRGGYWQDPSYFPEIKYGPVSSVPYWDERCGTKFKDAHDFELQLDKFLTGYKTFEPRKYVEANLTLEKCAAAYLDIYKLVMAEIN